jgi:hypothetical protein
MYDKPRPEWALRILKKKGSPSQKIEVVDKENNQTTTYDSISEAARALNLPNFQAIANYIKNNQTKPYKGRYTFKNRYRVRLVRSSYNCLNYLINQNYCYILIIPGFGIISTVVSASSNKNVFGQDGPLTLSIERFTLQLSQQTTCRKFKNLCKNVVLCVLPPPFLE